MTTKEEIAKLYEDCNMYNEQLIQYKATLEIVQNTPIKDLVDKLNEYNDKYDGNYENEIREVLVKRWNVAIDITKEFIQEEEEQLKNIIKPKYAKKVFDELRAKKK